MKIFLVRHGQSIANAKKIHQGQRIDTSLSEKGIKQAEAIATRLKKEKIDAIYSSDLLRAKETAEVIAKEHKMKVITDKRLREFDIGDLTEVDNKWEIFQEHRKKEAKRLGIKTYEVKAPGGESDWDMFMRVKGFLEEIMKKKHKNIVIVAHGGPNKVLFGVIKHLPNEKVYDIKQGNCCLNEIEFDGKAWKVHRINCMLHLDDIE